MKIQKPSPELVLGNIPKIDVPEIKIRYNRSTRKPLLGNINSPKGAADFIRKVYVRGDIQLQEQFIVILLNQGGGILGYYRHTTGGINATMVDVRLILATALKCAAVKLIIAHNHPSGNLQPSQADKEMTKKLVEAAELMNIIIEDHLIVTKEGHYSFKDNSLLGITKPLLNQQQTNFLTQIEKQLQTGVKQNKKSVETMAQYLQISDRTEIKELTELAIVNSARKIAHSHLTIPDKFDQIVELYQNQMILSLRTSQSILLQQYSTPAPIGYLMGIYCNLHQLDKIGGYAFEPSAGNGLLTIAANPQRVYVNEIDEIRNRNLKTQGFANVFNRNAIEPFSYLDLHENFNAVITNPPFGRLANAVKYETFPISDLDHLMALRALDTMANDGKAAIIIGGHTKFDDKGRIQAGKNRIFFNYLYSRYIVEDIIPINGSKLYTRQGTSFDTRLILINGRKEKPQGNAPLFHSKNDKEVNSFNELFDRVMLLADDTSAIENKQEKSIAQLYQKHLHFSKQYADTLIFLRDEDNYIHFPNPSDILRQINGTRPHAILINKQPLNYHIIPFNTLEHILYALQKEGQKVALIDELKKPMKQNINTLENKAQNLLSLFDEELGMPYTPASNSCIVLNTQVPDSMGYETHTAIAQIKEEVGGDIDAFVRHRLHYISQTDLCKALSAEQIDAVAVAIYNIEAREQGMIIGDQTGIGKGRIAAAMIRYAVLQKKQPVFITEKANLFSDIYRDLVAIGSAHLVPFIVNGRESKTDIKDEDGNIIYQALPTTEQAAIFKDRKVPAKYDFVVCTYTQVNSPEKKPEKPEFLRAIAQNNILILDEAHNSSGSSNTGEYLQGVVANAKGVVFLSATFAKRPDNMPIYAIKTAISDCNMSKEELVEAITKGGVALQEILSSQLVAEGQMIRRERSFEGVEINYITLEDKEQEHKAIADNITEILRDIIAFQDSHVDTIVEELDKIAAAEGKETSIREGTSQAGVDNLPYFSKVFQVINQMLFSIKAEAVADRAILRLKEGKKPVIAFASTMGSFIEQMENDKGLSVSEGDLINADFSEVLKKGLDGIMRYTVKDIDGNPEFKKFELSELPLEAQNEYYKILNKINKVSTGITISPIDIVVKKLTNAGYRVAEVTGRKYELQLNAQNNKGLLMPRKKINTNDAFRQFNNNEVDVLLINQSGSTGASAHAIVTAKVPANEVKQRVMIVLQAELDINTEVQKRGRINRTGQILKPIYDYINSAIPAEKRLMMMLQKKLKSLDANTTSNQKQSTKILDVPDFLNKYGDKVTKEYLEENLEINELLGDPLNMTSAKGEANTEDAAHKVSGRVAVLSTKMQADFYNEISERYNDYVDYLKQIDDYDLEVEAMNLQTETIDSKIIKIGKGGYSSFGEDSIMETVKANVLKKPFSATELNNLITESLGGKTPDSLKYELINAYDVAMETKLKQELADIELKYAALIREVPNEKKLLKLLEKQGDLAYRKAIIEREKELNAAKDAQIIATDKAFTNRKLYLERAFKFFHVGRLLEYPIINYGSANEFAMAVFIGFIIDKKKKNPYAPSAIKLRFAIANSNKYIAIPASYSDNIMGIIGASSDVAQVNMETLLLNWQEYTKKNTTDRAIRHIVTGNLLQAFSTSHGKLVSYTTMNGETKKGILMPEYFEPEGENQRDEVLVPIIKALPLIKSLANNQMIQASNELSIFKAGYNFKLIVPLSKARGGSIYLLTDLFQYIDKGKFESISNTMSATLPENSITKVIEILQDKLNLSIAVPRHQMQYIDQNAKTTIGRKPIELPPKTNTNKMRILELEAQALLLELELAA